MIVVCCFGQRQGPVDRRPLRAELIRNENCGHLARVDSGSTPCACTRPSGTFPARVRRSKSLQANTSATRRAPRTDGSDSGGITGAADDEASEALSDLGSARSGS